LTKLVFSTEDPNFSSITILNEAHIIGEKGFEFNNLMSSDSEGPSSLDIFSKPYSFDNNLQLVYQDGKMFNTFRTCSYN
jgi:hypothetical protein